MEMHSKFCKFYKKQLISHVRGKGKQNKTKYKNQKTKNKKTAKIITKAVAKT